EIEFNISNKGITDKFMNLVVSFNAINLKKDEIQIIDNIGQAKDVFTKYVKLYNIKYREELTDTGVFISFDFQCGISNKKEPNKISNIPDDSIISKSLAVLVVEDYIPNLNIVKLHLDKMGCDVFVATTGDEALSIFNRENIDVILMDIKMPIMDGWEATELIRASKKGLDTLIIGLTASSLDLDIRHCFESGMDDVLVKPIRKNQLFNKLDNFEKFKPEIFPTTASLRADYGISKIETDTLFTSAINQIEKQLEVIDILISAKDNKGMEKEMPAIINAALTINAFYYTRVIRNLYNAYTVGDKLRVEQNISTLKKIISKARNDNESLFWN
ncbi:MAG: response regulator, partial [Spirochaetales bacterium]|nr:response regulator [Spirochaetales bacterium]